MAAIRVRLLSVTRLARTTLAVHHSACPWRVWLPHRQHWPRKRAKQSLLILKCEISLAPHFSAVIKKHKQVAKPFQRLPAETVETVIIYLTNQPRRGMMVTDGAFLSAT